MGGLLIYNTGLDVPSGVARGVAAGEVVPLKSSLRGGRNFCEVLRSTARGACASSGGGAGRPCAPRRGRAAPARAPSRRTRPGSPAAPPRSAGRHLRTAGPGGTPTPRRPRLLRSWWLRVHAPPAHLPVEDPAQRGPGKRPSFHLM